MILLFVLLWSDLHVDWCLVRWKTSCRNSTTADMLWTHSSLKPSDLWLSFPPHWPWPHRWARPGASGPRGNGTEGGGFPLTHKTWGSQNLSMQRGARKGGLGRGCRAALPGRWCRDRGRRVGRSGCPAGGTHRAAWSPEQGSCPGCSHGWRRGCTPDSGWVGGYGCSGLACSMRVSEKGNKFNDDRGAHTVGHIPFAWSPTTGGRRQNSTCSLPHKAVNCSRKAEWHLKVRKPKKALQRANWHQKIRGQKSSRDDQFLWL